MKVLILGGCGYMGSSAARDLIKSDEVSQVVLVDKKMDMTKVHESVRNSKKISTLTLDITDFQALVRVIEGNDVVINTVGPYSRFGTQPVKAAIAAGVNYVDICDDCNVTKQIFDLDESARKAGVSICTGFGGGPGITNIIAKYAADKLDKVDEIQIFWAVALNDPFGQAGLTQAMSQFIGNVIQYIDGQWVDVPAGSGAEEVVFLEPVGKLEVYYAAHPEPLTLPRYISGVKNVIQKGGFLPAWVCKMFMEFINLGFITEEPLTVGDASIATKDIMVSIVQHASGFWKQVEQYTNSPAKIVVSGKEGNKRTTYTYRVIGHAAVANAICMSLSAQMLCRGEIKVKGVVAPEGAVNPKRFLDVLVKKGAHILEEKAVEQGVNLP